MNTSNSTPVVEPYLFFNGACEEALEFYRNALGAQIEMIMRYKESPEPTPPGMLPPGFEDKVMHASLRVGQTRLMASDGCSAGKASFEGFSLSVSFADHAAAQRAFAALAEGGEIRMPLAKTFWSQLFGMVQDRFGVGWMITVS